MINAKNLLILSWVFIALAFLSGDSLWSFLALVTSIASLISYKGDRND